MTMPCCRRLFLQASAIAALVSLGVVQPAAAQTAIAPPSSQAAAAAPARMTSGELMQVVETLSSKEYEGRRTGTLGNARARQWIAARFRDAGLTPLAKDFFIPFTFTRNNESIEGVNIVGLCKGRGAAGDDGAMVISAHYDHLGVRDDVLYPGADDNASGVAVVVALARRCGKTPWTHDVVFAAFDAEEQGLRGARAFVATPPIPQSRIRLNVNFDMVSRGDKGEIYIAGTYHRPELRKVLEPVAAKSSVKVLFGHDRPKEMANGQDDWTPQSDHGAFHAAGIPFVYFGVEDHPDYHKPGDTPEKINREFFRQAADTILDAVTALDLALPASRQ